MQSPSPSPLVDRLRVAGAALEVAPAHVVALLLLASCACAGLVALWLTARPGPSAAPTMPSVAAPSTGPSAASSVPTTAVVHVSGAVASAGVYELRTGARVVDALDAAGGPRDDARTERLNLARVVRDGEQIHVPDVAEMRAAPSTGGGVAGEGTPGSSAAATRLVHLNAASQTELEALPNVGPVLAARIVAHRERTGGFASAEDLLSVDGIGEKTFAELRDLVAP